MPPLYRDFMKQYRLCDTFTTINEQSYPIVNGIIVYHWVPCGSYNGKSLIFIQQCLDDLADVGNNPSESLDFSLIFADFDQMPTFVKDVTSGKSIEECLTKLTPYAQSLILQDLQEGCDIWEIINRRAAVLDDKYLGRTFDEVLQFRPELLQTVIIDDLEVSNIWKCSLE